jgi:predicted metalloprotease with PDZ domain
MVNYHLSFEQYYQHLIEVSIKFKAKPQQVLWLPTWIPGSYLVREFSKHIESVQAIDLQSNQALNIKKTHKNQWKINNKAAIDVEIRYSVYAYDLSVRGAYVDDERLYLNPAAICLGVEGQEASPIQLCLQVPQNLQHFNLATSLQQLSVEGCFGDDSNNQHHLLSVDNYATLIDHPIELAVQQQVEFTVCGIPHLIAISGRHQANLLRLSSDLQKICQTEIELFGDAPFDHYLFMIMATANSYGGLEHQTSTSLITPRDDLPRANEAEQPSANYQRFLGLCSHEYFHSWLVKFIRPHNFVNPNLHEEDYTSLLWIFEGFTSYYDDLILYRSGVVDQQAYLGLLTDQINRYLQNPGRLLQSVAESSFDAWIKYYRPDENSNNAGTSYYNKGALVALCLDLNLRKLGSSLDAVLQVLFEQAKLGVQVDESTIAKVCLQLTQQSFEPFLANFVDGTQELPLQSLLEDFGVQLNFEQKLWPLGLKVQEHAQGLLIQQVLRNSAAAKAGLSAQDIIVAIQGVKATTAMLQSIADVERQQPSIEIHVFRRDELKVFTAQPHAEKLQASQLKVINAQALSKWLVPQ